MGWDVTTKWTFRLAVIAAALMLAVIPFMAITATPCNPLPMSTLTAFELVRTTAEVQRVLGLAGETCRTALASQLDHANVVDTFAYIPAYTAFYGLTAWALGARNRRLGWLTVILAIACAIADVFENIGMFTLSAAPDAPTPWLIGLMIATNIKWVGLALVTTLCGVMIAGRGGLWVVGLPICAIPLVSSLWAVAAPDAAGQYLLPGMTIASIFLLLVAIWGAIRSDRPAIAST